MNELSAKIEIFIRESWALTLKYFKAKLIVSLILTLVSGVVFGLLDYPLYGLLGCLTGLSCLLPVVGPWLGALWVVVVLLFFEAKLALFALLIFIGFQTLESFFLTPLILGRSIDLKPLTVIAVVTVAGLFLGFWGVIFAIPIAGIIKIAYELFWQKNS